MTVVAHIDRNDPDDRTYVAIDQVIGPVVVGQDAVVIERTTGLVGSATITDIDAEAKMVVFTVDWDSLKVVLDDQPDPEEGGGSDFESSSERFGGRAQGPGGFRFGTIKSGRPPKAKAGPTVAAQELAFPVVTTPKDTPSPEPGPKPDAAKPDATADPAQAGPPE